MSEGDGRHEHLDVMRHSAAHVLAKAVQQLYPGSKLGIGPVIENGFYYDIDVPNTRLSEADLPSIEQRMREIVEGQEPFERVEWSEWLEVRPRARRACGPLVFAQPSQVSRGSDPDE